ncbi:uncharacterized protein PRCAT00003381001 [Priceomyces carsonii]|uniref:uncharacterized protein n=1 Tax=Priceomyces carsonii TaxID=28549 RepID=UPI002EDAA721|nr:unnamed protein product [Priceomyces carsonii]
MSLSLSKVSNSYFSKLFLSNDESAVSRDSRAKVLLLDKFTTSIISMCYTQSQLLEHDIILVELIENQNKLNMMKHLSCIVYIKPTKESIQSLIRELNKPHFSNYKLFLNNIISKTQLESLANADEFEVISKVIEIFQDYLIVNDNLFMINLENATQNQTIEESNSISSLLLSLRKCPLIKYESTSFELKKLSSEILYNINSNTNNNLFDELNQALDVPPLLLLLDRKNDPITPLISPWTYQSMIHELIGINRNIVVLSDKEQLTLSEDQDKFFQESMYLNYGDLTEKFQAYVEEYKKQTKQSSIDNLKTQNLSELKNMLTKFPEYRKLSNNILKHLNLISEIDKQISDQNLWEVGELQQTIICNLESQLFLKSKLLQVLDNIQISTVNKLKLILLYSVRFNNMEDLNHFSSKLNDPLITSPLPTVSQNGLIKKFRKLFSSNITSNTSNNNNNNIGNIFNNQRIKINQLFNHNSSQSTKTDNIYMQYTPKLHEILNNVLNTDAQRNDQTLSNLSTVIPDNVSNQYGGRVDGYSAQDIIIYIKGGVTYEEARLVHELNESNNSINLVIGGDCILNSSQWLSKLYDLVNES